MRIYTRKGDDGTTGLLYGGRVRKDSERPSAYGDVDEAQAALGLARAECDRSSELDEIVIGLQRDLWIAMAELATATENRGKLVAGENLVTPGMVARLEALIDQLQEGLELPGEFVLPGQNRISACLDMARAVVRRAERAASTVSAEGSSVVPYLNRLSDLLWIMARWQEGLALPTRTTDPTTQG
ncbi:MAG: Cob(I)yrinic acid a,c-diamide adenosyltransferase [Acidimicrobiales bacterium]|nr:MAG: cob(I)yrinic acid a,c-diamide adenosyltransferase [Actinomycetota bacterium]MBV6510107.1 Cob(I)yrinic acid a,c-diamide adenosyltransferase [Acidimicrobiales bacterium]RIK03599.1 MAG: cob(I)yrinic acid a,c-diamide adenosyltransferase [Acidobacteriota bacterium]